MHSLMPAGLCMCAQHAHAGLAHSQCQKTQLCRVLKEKNGETKGQFFLGTK